MASCSSRNEFVAESDRFGNITEEELGDLLENRNSKNTKRVVSASVKIFNDYLASKSASGNVNNVDELEQQQPNLICDVLSKFYADVRKTDGKSYGKKSLITLRFGLQKHFLKKCDLDIVNSKDFKRCNDVFKAVLVKLQREGAPETKHKEPISPQDLDKLYKSETFSVLTATGLLYRTFFEIIYYFCNRGQENLRNFQRCDFETRTDAQGRRYVCVVKQRETKNHRGDNERDDHFTQGRMYEDPGNERCPVRTYEKYVAKLHPENPNFWQRPKSTVSEHESVWYDNIPIGKNTLGSMMSTISHKAGLSRIYSNHCIRATCITTLDIQGVETRHIMGISGHKNAASLMSYSTRLSDDKKQEISKILCNSSKTNLPTTHSEPKVNKAASTNENLNNIDFLDLDDDILSDLLENLDKNEAQSVNVDNLQGNQGNSSGHQNTLPGYNIVNSTVNIYYMNNNNN